MEGLPLHPAIVHLPLGIAFIVPLLAAAAAVSVWKGWLDKKVWLGVITVQLIVFGSALVAKETGEEAEEVVKHVIAEDHIEEHEERAEGFIVVAGLTLAAAAAAWFLADKLALAVMALCAVLSVMGVGIGIGVGHSGGELVYVHQAPKAYLTGAPGQDAAYEHDDDDDED